MKKAYLLLFFPLLLAACQPKAASTAGTSAPAPKYPYTIKNPDNWDMDTSHANTMTALNCLKSFEQWDTVMAKKCFADTLEFNYDGGKFKGPISSFFKMISAAIAGQKDIKIKMQDWESVVSKDKKEEWVTLWYIQKWTDTKGKADSISYIDDMAFKAGRIYKMDEYASHFPPAKK